MLKLVNFNNSSEDLARYTGTDDIRDFLKRHKCDGLEYMRIPSLSEEMMPLELVYGIHLSSFQNWMDLWLGREEPLIREFGSMETVEQFYGGRTRQAILDKFASELAHAHKAGVRYVVFHVCEVTTRESFCHQFAYTDEEVIDASVELVNSLLDGKGYSFDFLLENLWWPGMNLTRPRMTQRMLDGVHYSGKGIMLDTGHLMNTNQKLRTPSEAVSYIHYILDIHEEIIESIKGIHLHQSLSGAYAEEMRKQSIVLKEDYWERFSQTFAYIFKMDRHEPFLAKGVAQLIERINPDYMTYEFITKSREEHEAYLYSQAEALGPSINDA